MIIVNKSELMNGSALRFGVPGSGKSFGAKDEMEQIALNTDDDILVCDPEREYTMLEKFGGEIIRIAAGSPDHINAMDMVEGYSDVGSPVAQKSQFVMSLLEQLDQEHELSSKDKSIIDRCTGDLYKNYKHGGPLPTLLSLRELLIAQPEPEARDLALSLELFTEGSLNAFAYPTNVNTNSRIVVYDILDLGEQLKTMGLLVITDAILNRVTENWKRASVPMFTSTSSMWYMKTHTAVCSSPLHGGASESAMLSPRESPRTWNTCWTMPLPAHCSLTRS